MNATRGYLVISGLTETWEVVERPRRHGRCTPHWIAILGSADRLLVGIRTDKLDTKIMVMRGTFKDSLHVTHHKFHRATTFIDS